MIDARDVAAVAARVIASPTPHIGKTYWPTGPAALSYAAAAGVLSGVLGRKIEFNQITFEQQRQAMIAAGLPESVAQDNATAVKLFADGEAAYVTDDVQDIIGRPARTFRQFVTDYVGHFS